MANKVIGLNNIPTLWGCIDEDFIRSEELTPIDGIEDFFDKIESDGTANVALCKINGKSYHFTINDTWDEFVKYRKSLGDNKFQISGDYVTCDNKFITYNGGKVKKTHKVKSSSEGEYLLQSDEISFEINSGQYSEKYSCDRGTTWKDWIEDNNKFSEFQIYKLSNTSYIIHDLKFITDNRGAYVQASHEIKGIVYGLTEFVGSYKMMSIDRDIYPYTSTNTWKVWVKSDYNTDGVFKAYNNIDVYKEDSGIRYYIDGITLEDVISSQDYKLYEYIEFTINDGTDEVTYYAHKNMTWGDWAEQGYSGGSYYKGNDNKIYQRDTNKYIKDINISQPITGGTYALTSTNYITFGFDGDGNTYDCEPGTAWEDLAGNYGLAIKDGKYVTRKGIYILDNSGFYVNPSDKIINTTYYIAIWFELRKEDGTGIIVYGKVNQTIREWLKTNCPMMIGGVKSDNYGSYITHNNVNYYFAKSTLTEIIYTTYINKVFQLYNFAVDGNPFKCRKVSLWEGWLNEFKISGFDIIDEYWVTYNGKYVSTDQVKRMPKDAEIALGYDYILTDITTQPTTISFVIGKGNIDYEAEYEAEEEMTWGEWVKDEKYNTAGYKINNKYIYTEDDEYCIRNKDGRYITISDMIEPDAEYLLNIAKYQFTIDGVQFNNRVGQTWEDWVKSDDNKAKYLINGNYIYKKNTSVPYNNVLVLESNHPLYNREYVTTKKIMISIGGTMAYFDYKDNLTWKDVLSSNLSSNMALYKRSNEQVFKVCLVKDGTVNYIYNTESGITAVGPDDKIINNQSYETGDKPTYYICVSVVDNENSNTLNIYYDFGLNSPRFASFDDFDKSNNGHVIYKYNNEIYKLLRNGNPVTYNNSRIKEKESFTTEPLGYISLNLQYDQGKLIDTDTWAIESDVTWEQLNEKNGFHVLASGEIYYDDDGNYASGGGIVNVMNSGKYEPVEITDRVDKDTNYYVVNDAKFYIRSYQNGIDKQIVQYINPKLDSIGDLVNSTSDWHYGEYKSNDGTNYYTYIYNSNSEYREDVPLYKNNIYDEVVKFSIDGSTYYSLFGYTWKDLAEKPYIESLFVNIHDNYVVRGFSLSPSQCIYMNGSAVSPSDLIISGNYTLGAIPQKSPGQPVTPKFKIEYIDPSNTTLIYNYEFVKGWTFEEWLNSDKNSASGIRPKLDWFVGNDDKYNVIYISPEINVMYTLCQEIDGELHKVMMGDTISAEGKYILNREYYTSFTIDNEESFVKSDYTWEDFCLSVYGKLYTDKTGVKLEMYNEGLSNFIYDSNYTGEEFGEYKAISYNDELVTQYEIINNIEYEFK